MLWLYVTDRWRLNSASNSPCCAGENFVQLRARTSFESVLKSIAWYAICSMRSRFWSVLRPLSCRVGPTWLANPSTTCSGVRSSARAAPQTRLSASAIDAQALWRVALLEIVLIDLFIVQIFLFEWRATRNGVVDLLPPVLHVGVAHEDVEVERRLPGVAHGLELPRALVDDVDHSRAGGHPRK